MSQEFDTETDFFSWKELKEKVLKHEVRRAHTLSKQDNLHIKNPDVLEEHSEWVKDAKAKNFVKIDADVKAKVLKHQKRAQDRRDKIVGNNIE
jgi:hypothetical protein